MIGNFNIPSVDHLREGVDYRTVDWDFASQTPVPRPAPGHPCPEGTKMIWGLCRRVDKGGKPEVGNDTDQERALKAQAEKEGSKFENNKAVSSGGKKYGWAMKNGKPVVVEWGSVAGTKPKKPSSGSSSPASTPSPATTPTPPLRR